MVAVTPGRFSLMVVVVKTHEPWGETVKEDPKEIADGIHRRQQKTLEKGVEALSESVIGRKVMAMLKAQGCVTLEDLITAFEADAEARQPFGSEDFAGMQARACIRTLHALRTGLASNPAEP